MEHCRACGASDLVPHLRTAGEMGEKGLIPTTDAFGTALADLVRCRACGHIQLAAFPAPELLMAAYADAASHDYVDEEAGQRATARDALAHIEEHVPVGRLADLGCWVGFLLAEARTRGWEPVGVEPSAFASAYARDRLGLDVHRADLFDAPLEPGTFQAVVLADVIEHLVEPGDALRRVADLLAPGGVVYLTLPDAGSRLAKLMGRRWWSVVPTHLQYFTRHSMETLLTRTGYEPLWMGTAPKTFSAEHYLDRLGGYSPALARILVRAGRRTRIAGRMWSPDFRDRMAVIARRP